MKIKSNIITYLILFVAFLLIFILGDRYFLGDAAGRVNPSQDKLKGWSEIFADLGEYFLISLILCLAVFLVTYKRK